MIFLGFLIAIFKTLKSAHNSFSNGYFFSSKYRFFSCYLLSHLFLQITAAFNFLKFTLDLLLHNINSAEDLFIFRIAFLTDLIIKCIKKSLSRFHVFFIGFTLFTRSMHLIKKAWWTSNCLYVLVFLLLTYESIFLD